MFRVEGGKLPVGKLVGVRARDPSASVPCVSRLPPVFSNREGSAVAGTGGGFEDLQIQISQEVGRRCN
jgi:hypothetical protein